ncbi:MAG: polysaccharide deacetylase family protein [Cyanobacteria bacterium P01_E01_bin.35]
MSNLYLSGALVISLDLELYWGMRDVISLDRYQQHLEGVRLAIPEILNLFNKYNIHATWATLGFLYCQDSKQLQRNLPQQLPNYQQAELSPYQYLNQLQPIDNQLHFCPEIIEFIKLCPGQEIGTHTFSHYYCLEPGQTQAEFKADLDKAINTAEKFNVETKSLVFPRNQYNQAYLETIKDCGITCYRGNETSSIYNSEAGDGDRPYKRILRLIDAYLNLSGQNCSTWEQVGSNYPFNIPSSRFLRPYSAKLKIIDNLRLRRINSGLEYAANHGQIYHLWWHPHNFGVNLQENLRFLTQILEKYQQLNTHKQMQSLNMGEVAALCRKACQPVALVSN